MTTRRDAMEPGMEPGMGPGSEPGREPGREPGFGPGDRHHAARLAERRERLVAGLLADGDCCGGDGLHFAAEGCCRRDGAERPA
ncbi:MAG: hypothetical protein ACFE0R_09135 [Salinarimonas sp.]